MIKEKYFHKKAINVPIYVGKLVLILSNDYECIKKELPILENEDYFFAHSVLNGYKGHTGFFMILNFDYYFTSLKHGTIAHEAVHIADYIFDTVGATHDINNPEPFTYLVAWVTNEVYKFIKSKGMTHKVSENR